jgi:hypothetical protein
MQNDGSWETGDNVFIARVHKNDITSSEAWQLLSAIDTNKLGWSTSEAESARVFIDPVM